MSFQEEDLKNGSVRLSDDEKSVVIIDQTRLPNHLVYLTLHTPEEIYDAIKSLAVRGAPAIGICAGYSMYVLARQHQDLAYDAFHAEMKKEGEYLNSSRPTAVNLSWAIKRQMKVIEDHSAESVPDIVQAMKEDAYNIHKEDIEMCTRIAEYGL
ncbi:MAG: S-methyl-5-thioribose-1-phosphate isomerase, partial [Chordicoccus sp.]